MNSDSTKTQSSVGLDIQEPRVNGKQKCLNYDASKDPGNPIFRSTLGIRYGSNPSQYFRELRQETQRSYQGDTLLSSGVSQPLAISDEEDEDKNEEDDSAKLISTDSSDGSGPLTGIKRGMAAALVPAAGENCAGHTHCDHGAAGNLIRNSTLHSNESSTAESSAVRVPSRFSGLRAAEDAFPPGLFEQHCFHQFQISSCGRGPS